MPEQLGEIFEDLRKGHLSIKTIDPALPAVVDRHGAQVYTGITVGSLIIAGGMIVAAGGRHEWLGFVLFAGAAITATWHQLRSWWHAWQMRGR
jgi:hypothetical protein